MPQQEILPVNKIPGAFKIIFWFCALYFFLMGFSLIFLPGFLIKGLTNSEVNPAILGMLRGAGGSIIPYSLLYIMVANKPLSRKWAISIILMANVIAICLDIISLLLGEYKFSYAMIDLPVELVSILGIIIIWTKREIKTI